MSLDNNKSPALNENNKFPSDTPGMGVAGQTMCPYGFQKTPCLKGACEMWVTLNYSGQAVGRCAVAYNAIIQTELRQEIERLRGDLIAKNE